MKKILTLAIVLLALHFLAVAGAVAFLVTSGRLDKPRAAQIAELLFPPPSSQPATQPTTRVAASTTRPLLRLEELLAKQAGRPAAEQVDFIRNAFDEQYAQLDRRTRELEDLQRQIEAARDQLARDRAGHEARQRTLDSRESERARLERDEGFQAELQLYQQMPTAQVKRVFLGLDDETVARYLQAMQPRTASRILREFKTPEEVARLQTILDRIRKSPSTEGAGNPAAPGNTTGTSTPGPGGAPAPTAPDAERDPPQTPRAP